MTIFNLFIFQKVSAGMEIYIHRVNQFISQWASNIWHKFKVLMLIKQFK